MNLKKEVVELRKELIKKLCEKEGGKKQALDAGQAREVLKIIINPDFLSDLVDLYNLKQRIKNGPAK